MNGCATRSERGNQSVFAPFGGYAGHASLAALAKRGGPGRIRTCDNTVMSGAF